MGFFDNPLGTISGALSNPLGTLHEGFKVGSDIVNSPIMPVNFLTSQGIEMTTGMTGAQQLEIGAVGGGLAMAPVIGAPLQATVGSGLSEIGIAGAGLFTSSGTGATVGAAAPSLTAGGATLGALHEGAKLLPSAPAPSSPVTAAPAAADGLAKFTPWLIGGALVAKVFLF